MQNDQKPETKVDQLENLLRKLTQNQVEFHHLLQKASYAVLITDLDGKLMFCNEKVYHFFGFEPSDNNHDLLINEIFGKHDSKWKNQIKTVLTNGASGMELTLDKKNSKVTEIIVNTHQSFYDGKRCFISFLHDISDQKLIEKGLKNEFQKNLLIVDSVPAMIFIKDKENRFCWVNKAFEEQTGFKNENIVNKSMFELTQNSVSAAEDWKDDLEVIESGYAKRNIIEPLITDKHRWILTDKIPYRNIDGEIIGIIGFSIDISERKHAEEELLRSEKMFRMLFETAPDGIILSTLNGEILSTNNAIETLLGYSAEEMKALNYFRLTPAKWHKLQRERINNAIKKVENVAPVELEFIRSDRKIIPVFVAGWIILNEFGKPIQFGTYVKDLSIAKKAERLENSLLQKEKEQLEKDLDSKTRELNLKIAKLIEINALVREVISSLEIILSIDPKEKNKEIKLVISELMNHTNDDLWQQLELTFGQIHQSFYNKIVKQFPNLTRNEKRLCAFLKMNLSTKDISSITHQTIRSIEVARARLRIKMNLDRSESLMKYFSEF
jgi:PAS domain S-box-containing protein